MIPDLILLHAPSVYDFRQKTILYGPVSDLIPPSPVFEMYPIGLTSIAEYLERAGYQIRIMNLAVRMMRDKNFDAEEAIKHLQSPIFGIDLHWMVHCHGAIEVANIVKRCHPQAKVIFGGFSSSYFFKELMQYPDIDYVLRGDSTEEPFRQLMDCLKKGQEPSTVPNLVWRDKQGKVLENDFSYVPADLSNIMLNHYGYIGRSVLKYRDLTSYIPFKDWLRYPITAVLTCRGCKENCIICGGSAAASRCFYHRNNTAFRSPELVAKDVKQIGRFSNGPIFILGDLRQPGNDYPAEVLGQLQKNRVKNKLIFELWTPASKELLHQMSLASSNFYLEISPETHNEDIRKAIGRNYSNEAMEQTIADALSLNCGRLDIFFMIGLTKQTAQSVMETIDYCEHLLQRFGGDKRLCLFIAPISPFLDPGSLGFERPERYGYRVLFRTLEEHRQALVAPSWKYSLNYETEWMSCQQIAETSYEAILRLIRLKAKYGNIDKEMAVIGEKRIEMASAIMHRIDDILATDGSQEELDVLKTEIDRINMFPISEKIQLEVPLGLIKLKPWRSLWSLITNR